MGHAPSVNPVRHWAWLSWSGLLLPFFLFFDFVLISIWGYGGDWSPIWTAGRLVWRDPASIYDFALVTKLQLPILNVGLRPFAYPPSTLTLLAPLMLLPFWVSLAVVSIGGALALAWISSRTENDRLLLLLSPPVLFAAMIGQPTLVVTALVVFALSTLKEREGRAGVLLGLAALVKPTLLLMAPVGLVAGRHWRALSSAGATVAAIGLASILLFGFTPWLAWIDALSRFREVFDASAPLYRNGITPYALALRFGLEANWSSWVMLPVVVVGTVATFVRSRDWRTRAVAVIGGSLLTSPYAMNYELAALAPVVLTMRRERLVDLAVPIIWGASLFANASLLGLAAVYLWTMISLLRASPDDRGVERRIDVAAGEDDHRSFVRGHLAA